MSLRNTIVCTKEKQRRMHYEIKNRNSQENKRRVEKVRQQGFHMGSDHYGFTKPCISVRQVLGGQGMKPVIVIPYMFEGHLILSLDPKWVSLFGGKLSFRTFLDRRHRLCFVSEQSLR